MGAKRKRAQRVSKATSPSREPSASTQTLDVVLEKVGKDFEDTRRRIDEIHANALQKLRRPSRGK
jgi:hypothetical protein